MCGRFALSISVSDLPHPLRERLDPVHRERYEPREMIYPGEPLLSLRRDERGTSPALMLWGLIPAWCRNPLAGPRPFNARVETLNDKASFRGAWRHRRCLIPASCFFEKGWRIRRGDQQPFWLAGLWERWLGADGSEIESTTILTTTPNALIRPLHPRMPVVIPSGLEDAWMASVDGAGLRALQPLLESWDPTGWIRDQPGDNDPPGDSDQLSLFERL